MGCDIHMVLEQKVGNHWIGQHKFRAIRDKERGWVGWRAIERRYPLFADLAGVRGEPEDTRGMAARGMPLDASPLARQFAEKWGNDGHSHTWRTAEDFAYLHAKHTDELTKILAEKVKGETRDPLFDYAYELLGLDDLPSEDYRLVIFFDN